MACPAGLLVTPTATATVNLTSLEPAFVNVPEKDHEPEASGSQVTSLRASVASADGVGTPDDVGAGAVLEGCGALVETDELLEAGGWDPAGGLDAGGLQAAKANKPTAHPPKSGAHLCIFPPK